MSAPFLVDIRAGNSLFRGPRPKSPEEMRALGCKTLIDLESGWFEFINDRMYEEDRWGQSSKVIIRHLPLGDFFTPTKSEVDIFLWLVTMGLGRGNVYVHCLHGVDRTGYMIAWYRIRVQGWAPKRAVKEMLDMGFHKFPYYFWIRSLLYRW